MLIVIRNDVHSLHQTFDFGTYAGVVQVWRKKTAAVEIGIGSEIHSPGGNRVRCPIPAASTVDGHGHGYWPGQASHGALGNTLHPVDFGDPEILVIDDFVARGTGHLLAGGCLECFFGRFLEWLPDVLPKAEQLEVREASVGMYVKSTAEFW